MTDASDYIESALREYGLTDEQVKAVLGLMGETRAVAAEAIANYTALIDKYEALNLTIASALALADVATDKAVEYSQTFVDSVDSSSKHLMALISHD